MNEPHNPTPPPVHEPTQYSEPLPPWLHDELRAGVDKLPELRSAIVRAQQKCTGLLQQTLKNKEQGYTYTGHHEVIAHVRDAMIGEGLSVEQVTCDLEEVISYQASKGRTEVWKWRVVCLITHTSGAAMVRIVRALTQPNNKASFVASTAADRTLLMRLMRLGGTKEENPEVEGEHGHRTNGPPGRFQPGGGGGGNRDRRPNHSESRAPNTNAQPQGQGQGHAQSNHAQGNQGQGNQGQGHAQGNQGQGHAQGQGRPQGATAGGPPMGEYDMPMLTEWAGKCADRLGRLEHEDALIAWARVVTGRPTPKGFKEDLWRSWERRVVEVGLILDDVVGKLRQQEPVPPEYVAFRQGYVVDRRTGEVLF